MTDWDASTFEDEVMADMRAHGGAVTAGPLKGHPLLIMTSTGAKTGEQRRAILTWSRDGDNYMVAGSAGGSAKNPGWFHNIKHASDVTIEVANGMHAARATVVEGAERDRLWAQHVAALPNFAAYPEQTGRVIPMIRITLVD